MVLGLYIFIIGEKLLLIVRSIFFWGKGYNLEGFLEEKLLWEIIDM